MNARIVLATALALAAAPNVAFADTVLDDFESASSPAPWTFSNGPEFPGAVGSLTLGTGHTGHGAHLAWDFTCSTVPDGGTCNPHYVAASLQLATPVTASAISFWAHAPAGIHITLRAVDSTGQTFQIPSGRPIEATDATQWFRMFFGIGASGSHWGGANDGVFHGAVTALSVLAADPLEPGTTGALDFDDVTAIDALAVNVDALAPISFAAPPGPNDLASHMAVNIHFTSNDALLDIAQSLGFGWVRMDLFWASIERTRGVYDFSTFDGLVSALAARNMHALFILDYANALYSDGTTSTGDLYSPQSTMSVQAFAAYAQAAAQHFAGSGVRFEVWNEPNISFWKPTPDAMQYATLAAAAIAAVHRGDPNAVVSTGGLSGIDIAFMRNVFADGGAQNADAIGVHPYRQSNPETVTDELLLARSVVASTFSTNTPPVWDTEWGYSSTWYANGDALGGHAPAALAQQALYGVRELLTAWAVGFPIFVYYDLHDDGTDPTNAEHNFGLVAADNSDKPIAVAVRTLDTYARTRPYAGMIDTGIGGVHAMRLQGPGDSVLAIWSDVVGVSIPVTVTGATHGVIDMRNVAVATTMGSGSVSFTVRESDGPVYVLVDGPVSNGDDTFDVIVPDATPPQDTGTDVRMAADVVDSGTSRDGGVVADGAAIDVSANDASSNEPTSGGSNRGCGCRVPVSGSAGSPIAALFAVAAAFARRRVIRARSERRYRP